MKLSLGLTPRDYSVAGGVAYDTDAQAYFTANTAITSDADKNAINTFYLGLKSDGVYTKIKAMYLPLWSSASSNKWNLKDPRDLDAAFRLTFSTGWTHSSGGMTPNGTSAYANTFIPGNTFSSNVHLSFYSGTQTVGGAFEMGSSDGTTTTLSNRPAVNCGLGGLTTINFTTTTDARGFWIGSKRSNTDREVYRNGASQNTVTTSITNAFASMNIWIGGVNSNNSLGFPSSKQSRFVSIGLGLTDTEASNLSSRVNTLMAYFGINTYPVVSDADAQAYINANEAITSQSDANAINTFFTGLKTDGIYTKIKAMYLPIWGSAASSKWNLINNRTFDLTFTTGWTFSSGGALPNGTSAYANTFLTPSSHLSLNSAHLSFYSRTNSTGNFADMGVANNSTNLSAILIMSKWSDNKFYGQVNDYDFTDNSVADSLGFFCGSRTASNVQKTFKNATIVTSKSAASTVLVGYQIPIGARYIQNVSGSPGYTSYSNRQCSFASIGDGLTDTEAANFYTLVNTYQTALSRNV